MYNRKNVDMQTQCDADNVDNTDESFTNRRQHINAQKQYYADNVDEPDIVPSPIVIGNNNRNQSLLSDAIINNTNSLLG